MIDKFKILLMVLFGTLLMFSCRKDKVTVNQPEEQSEESKSALTGFVSDFSMGVPQTGPGTLFSGVNVWATITGIVHDESGQPIAGANVIIGNSSVLSDNEGKFSFFNIQVDSERAYVKALRFGYFEGTETFKPKPFGIHNIEITCLTSNIVQSFQNDAGANVTLPNGASIYFEPGDVSNQNGSPYTGTVNVKAKYLSPSDNDFLNNVPGDFRGIRLTGEEAFVQSYGVLAIKLTGGGGQNLNIAPGQSATISFPIPLGMASNAQNEVESWYYNLNQGNWQQEGFAVKSGSDYISEVEHFSFWTYGLWLPPRDFYCDLNGPSGAPMFGADITFTGVNGEQWGSYRTDATGILDGQLPATVDVIFNVFDLCGNQLYSQNLGNGTSAINLGAVTITPSSDMGLLTGTVEDCSNVGIPNALAYVDLPYPYLLNTSNYLLETNASGNFAVYISHCNNSVDVTGYDYANNVMSSTVAVPPGASMTVGPLQSCLPIDEYINFTLDGVSLSIIDYNDEVKARRSEYLNGNPASDSLLIQGTPLSSTVGEFWFFIPSIIPGTYPNCEMPYADPQQQIPIIDMYFSGTGFTTFSAGPGSITVNLTSYGGMGGYAEGTFSGSFIDQQGGSHTITGGEFRALIQN